MAILKINIARLHAMYLDKTIRMEEIAERFGTNRRRIHQIVKEQREFEPEKWPHRYAQNSEQDGDN